MKEQCPSWGTIICMPFVELFNSIKRKLMKIKKASYKPLRPLHNDTQSGGGLE